MAHAVSAEGAGTGHTVRVTATATSGSSRVAEVNVTHTVVVTGLLAVCRSTCVLVSVTWHLVLVDGRRAHAQTSELDRTGGGLAHGVRLTAADAQA